jgi:tetratricopeptide (TPR) repeat protein
MARFQHMDYFMALGAIPLLAVMYLLVLGWKKRTMRKIGDERLVAEMTKNYSPQRFAIKFILIVLAFAAGVMALANLRSKKGIEQVSRNGIDVMIALDVSKSMMAQDIKPSRLDRAKQLLGKLIDKLGSDRIGIVIFAGKAYLQMPLTGDHGAAKMYLSAASTDAVPTQGTVVADALQMCYSAFNAKEKKYKAVVLISDGEDHDEGALKITRQMADEGIVINTVGIGSPEGSTIVDASTNEVKKDDQGNTVITKLNEKELMGIAEKGNGIYQLYTSTDEVVSRLDDQLGSMDQRTVTEDSLVNYRYYFQWFMGLALLTLLAEFFLSEKRRSHSSKLVPAVKSAALLLIACCSLPVAISAQTQKAIIKKGNEAYAKKEYADAASNYKKVTEKDPANVTAQYNLGNALYKDQKADEAVSAYENVLNSSSSKEDRAKAFYNKGVVLQNNKKIPECIEAYKNALKLDPGDEDARQNLQKALVQQQQQKQQEQKDKQKKPKEEEKKEKQKPKEEQKNELPKPQPSKLTKQDAEEKLKALMEQEKNLQDKLRKVNAASPTRPEKDW